MNPALLINILIICVLMISCTGQKTRAPVVDAPPARSDRLQYHYVSAKETLYSIAWRYNLDYRELAKWNAIGQSFTIYPGQKIALKPGLVALPPSPSPIKRPIVASETEENTQTRSINKTPKVTKPPISKLHSNPSTWVWPAKGTISNTFRSNRGLHKGVDIQGKLGEPVVAAASGTVVYVGEGIRGYGKLIIVKHSEKFLSAYAHNDRLLVDEGNQVQQGQKIALMGSSGTNSVKLHFQIRTNGKEVDPLVYLPKQGR